MNLQQRYETDHSVWNRCARTYEDAIVYGHPDVQAYESFEEDFLDALLLYLIRDAGLQVRLFDVGCGSARLHLRYGRKTALPGSLHNADALPPFDPIIASGLLRIDGIDFSEEMLEIARQKLASAGLSVSPAGRLGLQRGSAFELEPMPGEGIPIAVAVCNTIGVMQGPEGAQRLFQAMRRSVEVRGGIAVISAYRKDAVASHALGNYESTMHVSGQPRWLKPWRFTTHQLTPFPLEIKRAYDSSPSMRVAARSQEGETFEGCLLERDPVEVKKAISSGRIRTLWDYESYWYSLARIRRWIQEYWGGLPAWHVPGRTLDRLRAAPAQLAVLDVGRRLGPFFARLGITQGI
ncbi:MAG: class I SAM-dependent methyltransferase [Candidatus Hydrogenedentes bacterium]|nr:class I SAM-dependent methyltransferase [Candidatus Hydrogenedentota bacterium]